MNFATVRGHTGQLDAQFKLEVEATLMQIDEVCDFLPERKDLNFSRNSKSTGSHCNDTPTGSSNNRHDTN